MSEDTRPPTVLIVEDEAILALDLGQKIEELGYAVLGIVASGEQAVAMALEKQPDLVLMDVHLQGGMDGLEAACRIHEAAAIPVVFLTAHADETTLKRAEASAPYGYLVKPIEPRELGATLLRIALVRRDAERRVLESEERLRLALDAAALGVWEWDPATNRIITGGHFGAAFGGISELVDEPLEAFLARVHPEDRAALHADIERVRVEGGDLDRVFRVLRPSHDIGLVESRARAYPHYGGARLVGVVHNITRRRDSEERVRQSHVVFETSREAILILNDEHRIVAANPAFRRATGYDRLSDLVAGARAAAG